MADLISSNTKKGAPSCGVYFKIKQLGKSFTLIENLRKICAGIQASQYEKNMHVFEYTGKLTKTADKDHIIALKDFLQSQGMVFIVREDINLAHEIKADGVIVKTFSDAEKARKIMGADAIIGIRLPVSRKKVEQALDVDIDYISMPINLKNNQAVIKLLQCWAGSTDKPCLIEGNISNNECGALVQAGATFIEGTNYVLKHPSGALQGIVNMLYAIDLAMPNHTTSQSLH